MPRNGTGTMVRTNGNFQGSQVWQNQAQAADKRITSPQHDTHDEDIASELTNSLPRDGQAAMTGILDAGGFRVRNVGAPVDVSDAIRRGDSFQIEAPQAAAGSDVDFLNIPSWARRLVLSIEELGTNGTNFPFIQLGTSAGTVTTGYNDAASGLFPTVQNVTKLTTRFQIVTNWNATSRGNGQFTLNLMDPANNTWSMAGMCEAIVGSQGIFNVTGTVRLPGTCSTVRLRTADTFNNGIAGLTIIG